MSTAQDRGWGPGWPSGLPPGQLTVATVPGRGKHGSVRLPVRRQVAPIVVALVTELGSARHRRFRGDWSWGYANRAIRGTSTPSNHSWGLAIDLDAPTNPMRDGPLHTTMPRDAAAIADRYLFRWGGTYTGRRDPMHYEFMGTPKQAADLVERLATGHHPGRRDRPPPDGHRGRGRRGRRVPLDRTLSLKDTGKDVEFLQRWLGVRPVDGIFGDLTRAAVIRYQRSKGLEPDGVVGPHTIAAMRGKG